MPDLVAFLTARLDERERRARHAEHAAGTKYDPLAFSTCETVSIPLMELYREAHPARVLREVAAKRRVMARHHRLGSGHWADSCAGCGTVGEFADPRTYNVDECPELRDLAAADDDHPNYNPAWRMR